MCLMIYLSAIVKSSVEPQGLIYITINVVNSTELSLIWFNTDGCYVEFNVIIHV